MMVVVIVVILWLSLGTGFLSFVAGLQSMDRELFEAAAIDGVKNRFAELWYITHHHHVFCVCQPLDGIICNTQFCKQIVEHSVTVAGKNIGPDKIYITCQRRKI